jgi:hypothetical protein
VLHNQRLALFTAAIMTTYHFHIHWSRIGLNNIWDTLWVPLILAPFAWGWRNNWCGGAILSGIAVGLSQYFYPGSRLGVFLLAFLILQYLLEISKELPEKKPRTKFISHFSKFIFIHPLLKYTLKTAIIATTIAAPLFLYAVRDPVPFFERSQAVWGWRSETIWMVMGDSTATIAYGWQQLWRSVGAFTAVPDVTGFYDPGVPLLIGLAAPLFLIGLLWALLNKRFLPVLWVLLTVLLGGFLLADPPGSTHYVVVIPAVCWLVAMPLEWLASIKHERLALALLTAVVAVDLYFYFFIYVPAPHRDLIHIFPTV